MTEQHDHRFPASQQEDYQFFRAQQDAISESFFTCQPQDAIVRTVSRQIKHNLRANIQNKFNFVHTPVVDQMQQNREGL